MSQITIPLPDLSATQHLAERLAPRLQGGDVLALYGALGAGKTTFARALINALRQARTEVPSPTYTLVQTYAGADFPIYHFDLYRLETPEEVYELGWEETIEGLALIEWPERAGPLLPAWRLDVVFARSETLRRVRLEPQGEHWQTRLHGF